MRVFLYVIYH